MMTEYEKQEQMIEMLMSLDETCYFKAFGIRFWVRDNNPNMVLLLFEFVKDCNAKKINHYIKEVCFYPKCGAVEFILCDSVQKGDPVACLIYESAMEHFSSFMWFGTADGDPDPPGAEDALTEEVLLNIGYEVAEILDSNSEDPRAAAWLEVLGGDIEDLRNIAEKIGIKAVVIFQNAGAPDDFCFQGGGVIFGKSNRIIWTLDGFHASASHCSDAFMKAFKELPDWVKGRGKEFGA